MNTETIDDDPTKEDLFPSLPDQILGDMVPKDLIKEWLPKLRKSMDRTSFGEMLVVVWVGECEPIQPGATYNGEVVRSINNISMGVVHNYSSLSFSKRVSTLRESLIKSKPVPGLMPDVILRLVLTRRTRFLEPLAGDCLVTDFRMAEEISNMLPSSIKNRQEEVETLYVAVETIRNEFGMSKIELEEVHSPKKLQPGQYPYRKIKHIHEVKWLTKGEELVDRFLMIYESYDTINSSKIAH